MGRPRSVSTQEQTGRTPAVIWQSDTLTRALQSVLVVPLTTNLDRGTVLFDPQDEILAGPMFAPYLVACFI